jgi:hypothetical protein
VEKKENPFMRIANKFGKGRGKGGSAQESGPKMVTEKCKSRNFVPVDDPSTEFADY